MQAKREYMNWKASLFNIEETANRSRTFISRSRMHLHNLASKVRKLFRQRIYADVLSETNMQTELPGILLQSSRWCRW